MRKVWGIHGGVHPRGNKQQSNQSPIVAAGIPAQLVFPLSQHIGAPAAPIVEAGQKVLKGEKIAEAKGFVSVPIHASTSGTVIAIENRQIPHPSGMTARCIIIDSDGEDQWIEHQGVEDYSALEKAELITLIREAGIAGMGGAGFPSAVKLSTRDDTPIDTLIINGAECEPYITADDMLMRERAEQVIAGAKILRHIINPNQQTLIGVENNKPEGIAALQLAAQGSGIEIMSFPTKYPSGGEKQLIEILTGRQVPSGGLPAHVGVVCQNIGTAVAIHRAIEHGEPLITRVTTVTGEACERQKNYQVLLGSPVSYLLGLSGFQASKNERLIMGGPMMGYTLQSVDTPIVKASNCVLAPTAKELPPPPPAQACIRCGMCAEACPVSLLPQQMYWFARGKEYDKLEAHNLADCIECGSCSFSCPSNIPLVQYYRASKADIRQNKLDAEKAEHSKLRFEARKQRLERQVQEKEAKRKARAEAAKARAAGDGDGKGDAVQAAIERAKAKKEGSSQATNTDPAQAAIEKARAKRAAGSDLSPRQKAEQAVEKLQKSLTAAETKLAEARADNSDKLAAFESSVSTLKNKLQNAEAELASLPAEPATEAAAKPSIEESSSDSDPAQQAIVKAMAKREAQASMSESEKLQQTVDSLNKRLTKARDKLAVAEQEGDSNASILAESIEKLEQKLKDAMATLTKLS